MACTAACKLVLTSFGATLVGYECARADMQAKLMALFLPTHILVPSCRRPNLRDRCLQKASRIRSGDDGRDLCVFLFLNGKRLHSRLPTTVICPTRHTATHCHDARFDGRGLRGAARLRRVLRETRRDGPRCAPPRSTPQPTLTRRRRLPTTTPPYYASTESARREAHDDPGIRN